MTSDCIFCRIASGDIKADRLYEDQNFITISDLTPQAPVHVLVIAKKHFGTILDVDDDATLAGALRAVQQTAKTLGLTDDGFRTVINTKENGGQTIPHLHIHILGGRFLQWPPG